MGLNLDVLNTKASIVQVNVGKPALITHLLFCEEPILPTASSSLPPELRPNSIMFRLRKIYK